MTTNFRTNYYNHFDQIRDNFFKGEEVSNLFKNKINEDDEVKTQYRGVWSRDTAKDLGEKVLIKLKDKLTECFPDSEYQYFIDASIKGEKFYNQGKRVNIYRELLKNKDLCQELTDSKITWEKFLESCSIT
jgi:hypothetical protein